MNQNKAAYEDLQRKLLETERLVDALRKHEVDAVVGEKSIAVIQLREAVAQLKEVSNIVEEKELALRKSQERYRAVADGTPLAIWVHDEQGNLVYINRAYQQFFGVSLEQARDMQWQDLVHPADLEEYSSSFREANQRHQSFRAQARVMRSDGQMRWIESYGQPRFFEDGSFRGMAGSSVDITERRQAEEEVERHRVRLQKLVDEKTADLRRSQTRLKTAIDATGGGIYEYNYPVDSSLYCSKRWAEMLGYAKDELPAWDAFMEWLADQVHPEDAPYVRDTNSDFLEGRIAHYDIEFRIKHKSGEWRNVESLEYTVERDGNGKAKHVVGILLDITERKRMEAQLMRAQKMEAMGQLAGGIAHDFNNMLQVITGFAYRTLRQLPTDSPVSENIEHIQQAARSAAGLTQQLLAFSSKQILRPRVISLNQLVKKTAGMLRRSLREDISVSSELQGNLSYIKADPVQLEQAMMNMAVNAQNAMPNGGLLHFETADVTLKQDHPYDKDPVPAGAYVMLAISDTGSGMDEITVERIFDPFFTTSPAGTGTGLGLSSAYGVIRQSGGVIRVYSTPGDGATFKIYLPRSTGPLDEDTRLVESFQLATAAKTILVVEDNTLAREFTADELNDLGYTVLQAADSDEALTVSRGHAAEIDLLLTDVILPGASGLEVSRLLTRERPEMATLFMTGYDVNEIFKEGKLIEGVRVLNKPFSPQQLAQELGRMLHDGQSRPQAHQAKARTASASSAANQAVDQRESRARKILIVDDEEIMAGSIAMMMKHEGYETQTAFDGMQALQAAAEFQPDFVLMDIKLPDMDGYELANRIKTTSGCENTRLIACSGYNPQEGKEGVFDEYLIKPLNFDKLHLLFEDGPAA
ncbi:MAG: response regulator [Chitinivibrionales bacterium]|nr:response regulator [Chitinivibrionales bacterium]